MHLNVRRSHVLMKPASSAVTATGVPRITSKALTVWVWPSSLPATEQSRASSTFHMMADISYPALSKYSKS